MVFYYPNVLGQMWPNIMYLIVYIIFVCAISWEYTLNKYLVKIYNKTILVSELLFRRLFLKFNITKEKFLNSCRGYCEVTLLRNCLREILKVIL